MIMNTEQKFRVQNTLNYQHKHHKGEVNKKPSKTVPDQTMSIREILTRYAHGLPIEAGKVPIYEGEDYTPDPRHMDLADRQTYMQYAKQQIQQTKQNIAESQKSANSVVTTSV